MASKAKVIVGYEHTDTGLKPMEHERYMAYLQEGIDELDAGHWVDHSVIKADVAAMRAEVEAERALRAATEGR